MISTTISVLSGTMAKKTTEEQLAKFSDEELFAEVTRRRELQRKRWVPHDSDDLYCRCQLCAALRKRKRSG